MPNGTPVTIPQIDSISLCGTDLLKLLLGIGAQLPAPGWISKAIQIDTLATTMVDTTM